jgi:hypothetical protein
MFCNEHDAKYWDARTAEASDLLDALYVSCAGHFFEDKADVVHVVLLKAFAAGARLAAELNNESAPEGQAAE